MKRLILPVAIVLAILLPLSNGTFDPPATPGD